MRQTLMKLALRSLTAWLGEKLPTSGKVYLPDLEAECLPLIDGILVGTGPPFSDIKTLDEHGLSEIYEWLFAGLVQSNAGNRGWGLAAHMLRLQTLEHLSDILYTMQHPRTLAHPASPTPNNGLVP